MPFLYSFKKKVQRFCEKEKNWWHSLKRSFDCITCLVLPESRSKLSIHKIRLTKCCITSTKQEKIGNAKSEVEM